MAALGARIELTNALLREVIAAQGWAAPASGRLHLYGVRGAVPVSHDTLVVNQNLPDQYNDAMGCFGSYLSAYKATTDPGAHFTRHPSNKQGAAHLRPGDWRYKRGLHKGRKALVQAAPVSVRRDRDRDAKPEDNEPIDTGWFGINHHAGGMKPDVGAWSAGCQVIWGGYGGEPWLDYLHWIYEVFPQSEYHYYLLNAGWF